MPFSPLAEWTDRAPRWRWPLVLVCIVLIWGLGGWIADPAALEAVR